MKKLILSIVIILLSNTTFGVDFDLGLRAGGGLGFSDMDHQVETHDQSHMFYGGIRPSMRLGKWDLGVSIDFLKYTITNKMSAGPYTEVEHVNENVLASLSPKYMFTEKFKIGPYYGRYLEKNILTLDRRSQDVVGIEGDYNFARRWAVNFGVEHSTDSSSNHRLAKLGITFALNPPSKHKPAPPVKAAPVCQEKTHTVYFAFDSHKISSKEMERLDQYLKSVNTGLVLGGHTDKFGSNGYNMKLSGKRVETVKKTLEAKGFKVDGNHYGEKRPVSDKHRENRRVEIKNCW